nr:choice-of-anchor G family protein [Leucobacter exalbidus]
MSQAVPAFAASFDACAPAGTLFDTEAQGRLLGGNLLGIDLDAIAQVVPANAIELASSPESSQTNVSPLSVQLLSSVLLNLNGLGNVLSDVLAFAAPADTGALAQYAYAHEEPGLVEAAALVGYTHGASGAVSDSSGAINFESLKAEAPQLATLSLKAILENLTGPGVAELLAQIADLDLIIGAVGGYARLDSLCQTPDLMTEVERDYVIAYLKLVVKAELIVAGLLQGVIQAIQTITIDTQALTALIGQLLGPIGHLLGTLLNQTLTVKLTVDAASLTAEPIPATQPAGLQIDFNTGELTLDLETLLGGAYDGQLSTLLNNQPPNSQLFVDIPIPGSGVTDIVRGWVIDSLIPRLLDAVYLKVTLGSVSGLLATGLLLEGTLRQFLEGTATATLRVLGAPILGFDALINGLLGGVGQFVLDAITNLLAPAGALNAVFDVLNALLGNVFQVLTNVVAIILNEQWETPQSAAYDANNPKVQTPRYHEAALNVRALGVLNVLDLKLGTGYAGHHTQR